MSENKLLSRLMRGVLNKRPPVPRYKEIWDVQPVLGTLRKWSPVKKLKLKELTSKLCCLFALLTAQRAQTISLFSLDNMLRKGSSVVFNVTELIKQSRPGNVGQRVEVKGYPPDRRLCVLTVLDEYLQRTQHLRGSERALFISFKAPHDRVSKDTISRWIRSVLELSGIDVNVFKAHSTRAASTSAAKARFVPISNIMDTAGWSNAKTFQKFYDKPMLPTNDFVSAILE